jgi:adenylate kinase family enzyme
MKKIAIIGSPGAGKTTLAITLNRELHIKVYHLDRLFWKIGWQRIDGATRIDTMQDFIREEQWIIEGTYLCSSEPRLNEADTIIFLDTPTAACLLRVIKRHRKEHGLFRRDIPEQCVDKLNLRRMWKLLVFPIQDRIKLKQKLLSYKSKEIIRLRSKTDIEDFLLRLELSKMETSSVEKEGCLVTTQR